MRIEAICVSGYRSVRHAYVPMGGANVIVGPNGSGKTNLYRGMLLIHEAAQGRLAEAIAGEGGMKSAMWAGARKVGPVRLALGVQFEEFSYAIECGLPPPSKTKFELDPEVKEERIHWRDWRTKSQMLGRKNGAVWARDGEGKRADYPVAVSQSESVLGAIREPHRFPVLSALRQEILGWRFYHHFRTDADSPVRQPQVGVRTHVLSNDGRDLAAAIQTILEVGNAAEFRRHLEAAFPGASIEINSAARFSVEMGVPGMHRPFDASELSDGTLQYLCLLAALLSPRPPTLLALNEPEASIHPDLIGPLARLIVDASARSQLWVTTHSTALATAICEASGERPIELEKVEGETRICGQPNIQRVLTI